MPEQPALISMAQQFSGLPMDKLIGGPLLAAAEANHNMALTQTEFMLSTCFDRIPTGGSGDTQTYKYDPIMIQFTLVKGHLNTGDQDGDGNKEQESRVSSMAFQVPLLTLIPLNSLAVDTVDIDFNMEVKSSFGEENTRDSSSKSKEAGTFEGKGGWGPFSVRITGNISHESENSSSYKSHYQKSNKATYDVKVHAKQLPVPEGVGVIIQAFTKAITQNDDAAVAPAPAEG